MTTKLEAGGQEQFTLTTSVACDANPLFFIKDWAGTLVSSGTAQNSGSGYYYKFASMPSSVGMYTYNWHYSVSANTMIEAGMFEVVQTLALESDLYCNANDIRNMYEQLRDSKMRNAEIDAFIRDSMNVIDSALGGRYAVPFATGVNSLPPIVSTLAKNLTLVAIMERKPEVPEWVDKRRDRYEGMLDKLATGEMTLVLSGGTSLGIEASATQVDHSMSNYTPTFNMLDVEYQRIDPDRESDEVDAL